MFKNHQQQMTNMITGLQAEQASFISESKVFQQSLLSTIKGHALEVNAKFDEFAGIQHRVCRTIEDLQSSFISAATPSLCDQPQIPLPVLLANSSGTHQVSSAMAYDSHGQQAPLHSKTRPVKPGQDHAHSVPQVEVNVIANSDLGEHHSDKPVMQPPKCDSFSLGAAGHDLSDSPIRAKISISIPTTDDNHVSTECPAGVADVSGPALELPVGSIGEGKATVFIKEQMSLLTQALSISGNQKVQRRSSSKGLNDQGVCQCIPEELPHEVSE